MNTPHRTTRSTGPCECALERHAPKLLAITGGPGAGKTAVLEIARRSLCPHVAVLPEAASIVFAGGFPRGPSVPARRGTQRAIFHVQTALERILVEEHQVAIGLCDRGTVDSVAYWPESIDDFWREVHSDQATELARYSAVIHLRTPSAASGYNHSNPLRTERASDALRLDQAIEGHDDHGQDESPIDVESANAGSSHRHRGR